MIANLIIRIIAFTVSIALLVGGAIISYTLTVENTELHSDINDVMVAPWLPILEDVSEGGTSTESESSQEQ